MPDKRARADVRVAGLASRQHGVVSSRQLREAGLSRDAVLERCRTGRLHRLHRGVYAVGHTAPSDKRRWMAAVLAVGDAAALSHRSAAALWRMLPTRAGPVDVSLPGRTGRRQRKGIRIHRPVALSEREATRRLRIPVTTPPRTIADLRGAVSPAELRGAIRQAEALGLATGLAELVEGTRSELEWRFLRLCRRAGLPAPEVNVRIGPLTVDFLWGEERLVVETDGYRYHRGREAFEGDRSRDLELRSRGFEVVRLSYRQVVDQPERVAEALRRGLKGRASWR